MPSIEKSNQGSGRLAMFWVLVWMPTVSTLYMAMAVGCGPATPLKAWIGWLAFVYVLFAPALWHAFFPAHTNESSATRGEGS